METDFIKNTTIKNQKGGTSMNINKEKMQLAMANACMNTTQLSKKADISRFSLNAYVNKTRNPKPATVGRIAKALNVKVEDLVE